MSHLKCLLIVVLLLSYKNLFSQNRWHPYAGLHGTMDAGGYYVGPSIQFGTDYYSRRKIAFSAYLHYFREGVNQTYMDGFERGKFRSFTLALLMQNRSFRERERGFFIAGGPALQRTSDNYVYDEPGTLFDLAIHYKRTIVTSAFRFGYTFPLNNKTLAVEINGTGPYIEKYADDSQYIEILSQLSLGVRIGF